MRLAPVFLTGLMALSGCAEYYLAERIRAVEGENRQLDDYHDMERLACPLGPEHPERCSISGAVQLAFEQADAYAEAARRSQVTQDVAFAGLLGAAGWTALGAANEVSNAVLAERAVIAVAVQQASSRSVPQTAIQSLYTGANRMNCIALAGSLYQEVNMSDLSRGTTNQAFPSALGSFIMVLAMREVEYRTLHGTSRELGEFSTLVAAFRQAAASVITTDIPGAEGRTVAALDTSRSARRHQSDGDDTGSERYVQRNPALERFFGVVSGCLESGVALPDTTATNNVN